MRSEGLGRSARLLRAIRRTVDDALASIRNSVSGVFRLCRFETRFLGSETAIVRLLAIQ